MRTAQPTRAIRAVIACLTLALATLVVPLRATADASDRPDPPRFLEYGITPNGHATIVWRADPAVDGVNVYRNGRYIATVRGGNVYNDFSPGISPSYELTAFKGDRYSSKTNRVFAGRDWTDNFRARVQLGTTTGAVTIRWSLWGPSLARYEVYRLDSGGTVRWGQGTRIGWGRMRTRPGSQVFVDTSPRRGASYGIRVIRANGTSMPMVTVKPDYSRPVISLRSCGVLDSGCTNPFEPTDPLDATRDPIEVIDLDPSLHDWESGTLPDPGVDMMTGAIESSNDSGLGHPGDRPQVEVPLNEHTDPDNDGLSVFSDTDNDNDGVPTAEDQNDLDDTIGRRPSTGGGGGGGGGGDGPEPNGPSNNWGWGNRPCGEFC